VTGAHLLGFVGVAGALVITPGVDMALVTKNALGHGRRAALATAAGVNLGIAVWTVAAALGLAAVVAASATAFAAIKLAGVAYLLYLGVRTIRSAGTLEAGRAQRGGALRQGLVSNLLNPKIAVFFTSLLPQFGSSLVQLLLLGAIFNALGIVWLTSLALVAARGRRVLARPRVRAALDYLSGVVLVGLGVRLAFARRG
jgi:threonine/homoserine/homoserine lactone efflux protein